jgi:hypothetical protein
MTEEITIHGGHIRVDRVAGKAGIDVAVADVSHIYFERGARDVGALVVVDTNHRQHVIHIDNEDAPEAVALVKRALGTATEQPDLLSMISEGSPVD